MFRFLQVVFGPFCHTHVDVTINKIIFLLQMFKVNLLFTSVLIIVGDPANIVSPCMTVGAFPRLISHGLVGEYFTGAPFIIAADYMGRCRK